MGQLKGNKRPLAWNETQAEGTKRKPRQPLRDIYIKQILIIDRPKKKHNGKTESIHTLQWKEEGERLCVLVPSWTSVTGFAG